MFAEYIITARADKPDLGKSVGPMYWGLVLAVFTCGISVVQAHYYFRKNHDRPWLRWTAGTMFSFDLISTALVIAAVFEYFVPRFGDVSHLWQITPALAAECIFAIFITFIAQFYFGYQIYCVKPAGVSGQVLISVLAVLAVLSMLFGCVCFTMMFVHSNWEHWALAIQIGFSGSKGFAMLFDIISTITMCMFLKRASPGLTGGTKRVIQFLVYFCLQRGALVTLVQTMLFVVNWAFNQEMYWLTPHLLVTRLYVNTFFAMLNSRKYLRNKNLDTKADNESMVSQGSALIFGTVSAGKTATVSGTATFEITSRESEN
ncbi:hypothetical protein FPV67DRAFT_1157513 [Lyophyllum atratum]|nr:hypothetical protein FPV67DRAFT_1157513 [Lyophyllum atratum]